MNQSTTISALAKALSDFQGEVSAVPKESSNPFYKSKYAELSTIIAHAQKLLKKNGLSVSQLCNDGEDKVSVTTLLMHTSGEWLSGTITMKPSKPDPQGVGSAITYARRYSLSAILGLATEDDDDGNVASGKTEKPAPVSKQPEKKTEPVEDESTKLLNKALEAIKKSATIEALDKIEQTANKYKDEGRITQQAFDKIGTELTNRTFEITEKGK